MQVKVDGEGSSRVESTVLGGIDVCAWIFPLRSGRKKRITPRWRILDGEMSGDDGGEKREKENDIERSHDGLTFCGDLEHELLKDWKSFLLE